MKIDDELYSHYRSRLDHIAEELTRHSSCPINVLDICERLNIEILKDSRYSNKAVLISKDNNIGIKLSERYFNEINSPFIRHILAHEIGHYILQFDLEATITGDEYWVFEELCDFFSRSLLIPKRKTINETRKASNDLQQLYNFSNFITKKYNVTWITSVNRVKDFLGDFLFLNLKNKNSTSTFKVNKSLLLKKKYLNSQLELDSKFLYTLMGKNKNAVLLKSNTQEFSFFQKKFPLIFNPENREALIIFRPNNIAFMAKHNTQQRY